MVHDQSLTLEILPGTFAVAQLESDAQVPTWAIRGSLLSITRTQSELSIVCTEASVPTEVRAQRNFRCLRVAGPLNFDEIGVLASLANPLARAGISIFALSTYDTDYLLVSSDDLETALSALMETGHTLRTFGAE